MPVMPSEVVWRKKCMGRYGFLTNSWGNVFGAGGIYPKLGAAR